MKYIGIGVGVVVVILLIWTIIYMGYNSKLEKPNYQITDQYDGFEIREYDDYIVAKVKVDQEGRRGLNQGFTVIADFIFGNNTSGNTSESIAMTSPVIDENESQQISMTSPVIDEITSEEISMTTPVNDERGTGERYISFVMPSKYTMENLPKPNNDDVIIEEVKGLRVATKIVKGSSNLDRMNEKLAELRIELNDERIEFVEDNHSFAFYDPPLTPVFLKRNEVMIKLK